MLQARRERYDTYTLSLMEHGQVSTEQDIAWLDGLIRAERNRTGGAERPERRRALRRKERTT